MDITCVSDLHGFYPKLEGGDLLIIAGDLTARGTQEEFYDPDSGWEGDATFIGWLDMQNYEKIIIIAGNHDNFLKEKIEMPLSNIEYLCDSGTEFQGLKIWGSPWTLSFKGMNPKCKAFTCETEEDLAEKWKLIPDDIDILITHGPPYGILDKAIRHDCFCMSDPPKQMYEHVGSKSLGNSIEKIMPEMVLFGHIHEQGGKYVQKKGILYINGSVVDEGYRNVNRARRIIFDEEMPKMQRFKIIE